MKVCIQPIDAKATLITEYDDLMCLIRTFTTPPNAIVTLTDGRKIAVLDIGIAAVIPPMSIQRDGSKLFHLGDPK